MGTRRRDEPEGSEKPSRDDRQPHASGPAPVRPTGDRAARRRKSPRETAPLLSREATIRRTEELAAQGKRARKAEAPYEARHLAEDGPRSRRSRPERPEGAHRLRARPTGPTTRRSGPRGSRAVPIAAALTLLAAAGAFVHNLNASGDRTAPAASPTRNAVSHPRQGVTLIRFLSSPVPRGGQATIRVLAAPYAACSLTMTNDLGTSLALPDAGPLATNASGEASRTWRVDPALSPGTYRVIVSCSPGSVSTSTFAVS